jgi:hypothetical protein
MASALLAAAVFFIWQSALLPFGKVALPGPGFFPFALGIVLAILALAIIAHTLLYETESAKTVFIGHRDVLIALAALVGLAATFEQMDAYLTLGVFTAVLLLFIARTEPWRAALGAVLGMVGVWIVFRTALGVRLPTSDIWQDSMGFIVSKFVAGPM